MKRQTMAKYVSIFVFIILTAQIYVEAANVDKQQSGVDDNDVIYSGCNAQNFNMESTCTLTCQIELTDNDQLYSAQFYYYSYPQSVTVNNAGVKLLNDVDNKVPEKNDTKYIAYTLKDYNAGYYVCDLVTRNLANGQLKHQNHWFQIETGAKGKHLNEQCKAREECLALNGQCVNDICRCSGINYIRFNHRDDTPACLSNVLVGGQCNVDAQCQYKDRAIRCEGGYCIHIFNPEPYEDEDSTCITDAEIACIVLSSFGFLFGLAALVIQYIRNRNSPSEN